MTLYSTEQLIRAIFDDDNKFFEVELILDGGVATHFIYAEGQSLFDEGIDGVKQKMGPEDFLDFYKNNQWNIFQVV